MLATSAIPVAGPVIAGIGAAVLVGSAVGEVTDGLFDDVASGIGDTVENIAYGIGDAVSSIGEGISDFVGGLFWWA